MNTKRKLHIHISVDNIEESVKFYNTQFGAEATKVKDDYAQWLIEDLSLNFAISTRAKEKGLNHLGVQYESDEALESAQTTFEEAGIKGQEDKGATCCYKESNKYWVTDPTGMVWENYHSTGDIEVYGLEKEDSADACCVPKAPNMGMFTTSPSSSCGTDNSDCC
jgi:catechol 2,3-dioxygenase-like lactoylglutathione lyase family enzyme